MFLGAGGTASMGAVRMRLPGANRVAHPVPESPLPGKINYFIGGDSSRWRTNIPTYGRISYRRIYPGIDLVYYGNRRELEYDFRLQPGADPSVIGLALEGADDVRLDGRGDLIARALRLRRPVAYQGARRVACRYVLRGKRVTFSLGPYDSSQLLVIDPVILFATFLGGSGKDFPAGIGFDRQGNVYVAGYTTSVDFPITGKALQPANACPSSESCTSVFVSKLNPSGSALLYSTYFGGRGGASLRSFAVDQDGNAYLTGTNAFVSASASADVPLVNPRFTSGRGFVAKLSSDGSRLIYSTMTGVLDVSAIAADNSGNTYLTGTAAAGFPATNDYHVGVPLVQSSDLGDTWVPVSGAQRLVQPLHSATGVIAQALTADPRRPGVLYATGVEGLFKSIDAGASWRLIAPGAGVLAVMTDPNDAAVLYYVAPNGLYKTTDDGSTWNRVGPDAKAVGGVLTGAVDPHCPTPSPAAHRAG